ncbi:MAG: inositol monophosphatase [Patescibacteria group bacterium]|jgi:fructose-1,6-bisphosphatase/inositol monophosphatase family enzyme
MTPKSFSLSLAEQAGKIISQHFNTKHEIEIKHDESPVTIVDKTVNLLVLNSIKKEFPNHGFIGEEGGSFSEKAEYVWICDPLDGTIPFSAGMTVCCFTLALLRNGQPILGVIYNPFTDRLYFAEKNKGAFLNDEQIHVSKVAAISRNLIGICVWNNSTYDLTGTVTKLISLGMNMQTGSTSYLGALVASGEAVANIFPHNTPWDIAAQKIIIEEAGGKVTDMFGNDQKYDGPTKGGLISNGIIHDKLIEIIKNTLKY